MTLLVRIAGREGEYQVPVPRDLTPHEELTRFLNRQGPYAQIWIQLTSGAYVRYDHVVSIRIQEESEDAGHPARLGG